MNLRKNVAWNVAEVVVSSCVLFGLYKLILSVLSVEALGVWSLVLATTSLARVADVGAAGGLARYISVSNARDGAGEGALVYVETALLLNLLLYGCLAIVLYWPAYMGLGLITKGAVTAEARSLLPYAMGSFVMMNLSNVLTSGLLGFHRSYQKSMVALLSLLLQVGLAAILIKSLGLRGVAIGQIAQNGFICVVGWMLVVKATCGRFKLTVPHRMRRGPLKDLLGFGLKLQGVTIASFLYEPATKFVFSAVGGVHALGLFEMASRLTFQARQVLVMPSMNLTPIFADASVRAPQKLVSIYARATTVLGSLGCLGYLGLALLSPVISLLWLGKLNLTFVTFVSILSVAWFINLLGVPAYLMGVGVGRLRWNLVGGFTTTLVSPVLGIVFARFAGPGGVALAAGIAIASGALITMLLNCRDANLRPLPSFSAMRAIGLEVIGPRVEQLIRRAA